VLLRIFVLLKTGGIGSGSTNFWIQGVDALLTPQAVTCCAGALAHKNEPASTNPKNSFMAGLKQFRSANMSSLLRNFSCG